MSAKFIHKHKKAIRAGLRPSLFQGESTEGNTIFKYEQEVDISLVPDMTPVFGIQNLSLENERNANRSYLKYDNLDIDDLYTKEIKMTPQEMGGQGHSITSVIEDATGGVPEPTANSLHLISSKIEPIDRAHSRRIDETVDSWKELTSSVLHHPDAGGNQLNTRKQVVAPGTALVSGPLQVDARLEAIDDEKSMQIYVEADPTFGVMQTIVDHDPDGLGYRTSQTEQIKDDGYVMPAATFLTIAQSLVDKGNGKHSYKNKTISAWPVVVDQEEEEETGMEVLVTRTVVDKSALPTMTKGVARSVKSLTDLDEHKALYVERVIDANILTTSFTEYHNTKYYFPSYLDATNPFSAVTIETNVVISVNKTSDHEFSLPCRYVTTYLSSVTTVEEVFQFKAVDISFSTPSVHENNVLVDEGVVVFYIPYVYAVIDGVSQYDHSVLSYGISASSPTTTEYLALMGSEVLIADEISRWKYNLWKRTKVYMKLPDLSLGLSGYLSY